MWLGDAYSLHNKYCYWMVGRELQWLLEWEKLEWSLRVGRYAEYPTLLDSGLTITMRSSLTIVEVHTEVEADEDRGGVSLNCRSRSRIQMWPLCRIAFLFGLTAQPPVIFIFSGSPRLSCPPVHLGTFVCLINLVTLPSDNIDNENILSCFCFWVNFSVLIFLSRVIHLIK